MTTTAIKPVSATSSNAVAIIKPEQQQAMIQVWTKDLNKLTEAQGFNLTQEEKNFGTSMITGLVSRCVKDKIDTRQLNMTAFLEDVKHNSKLQMSLAEQDVYLDIRNNGATGLKDVTIKRQYQGVQKIMRRFSTKKIVRFADGIVCQGDVFENKFDFATGLNKIVYEPNANIDHNDLKNITNAFAIAYVEELGTIVPYVCVINKQRIMRAFNASAAGGKGPWSTDTARMVRKTAYWCLYNDVFKPYIEIPSNLQESFAATEDEMDFNATAETNDEVYDMPVEETNDFTVEQDDFQAYLNEMDNRGEPTDVIVGSSTIEVNELVCSNCGKKISDKVAKYSQDKFGRHLCMDCQKNS